MDEILREECSSFEDRQEVICSWAAGSSLCLMHVNAGADKSRQNQTVKLKHCSKYMQHIAALFCPLDSDPFHISKKKEQVAQK